MVDSPGYFNGAGDTVTLYTQSIDIGTIISNDTFIFKLFMRKVRNTFFYGVHYSLVKT